MRNARAPFALKIAMLLLAGALFTAPAHGQSSDLSRKKLVEFGWDEPDTAFLRAHIAEMQRTPFDGCVFHVLYSKTNGAPGNFTWESWGRKVFSEEQLRGAFADLRAVRLNRELFEPDFARSYELKDEISVDWVDFLVEGVLENF